MFSTVEMSRLTMAGPSNNLDEVLRLCANLGNVHIKPYSGDVDGITVGRPHPDADEVSAMLAKVRSAISTLNSTNKQGPISAKEVAQSLESFSEKIDSITETIAKKADATAEISKLQERVEILTKIAPLGIPLELMTEISAIDVYLGETSKAGKANQVFGELRTRVELHSSSNIIAVACKGKDAAEVQMAMQELGAKSIQIPSGEGKPGDLLRDAEKEIAEYESTIQTCESKMAAWNNQNGRMLLAVQEHLERESDILTGHTLCATSAHAFAMEAWVPSSDADEVRSILSKVSSHLTVEEFKEDHGHGHDDDHHHDTDYPPVEYDTIAATKHATMLTSLVGRPKYGSVDPTSMLAFTFPIFYGLILGDAGYGLVIMLLALLLKSKIGHDPFGKVASRILMNMGIATFIVGVLTAEAFGFVIEKWDAFVWLYEPMYENTKYILADTVFVEWFGLSHTYLPFHRASGALTDYILLSIYLGMCPPIVRIHHRILQCVQGTWTSCSILREGFLDSNPHRWFCTRSKIPYRRRLWNIRVLSLVWNGNGRCRLPNLRPCCLREVRMAWWCNHGSYRDIRFAC